MDSSTLAFMLGAFFAFKEVMQQMKFALLEPVMNVTVEVPSEFMGEVIGDINAKRGKIIDIIDDRNNYKKIHADVPLAELFGYINTLREKTQGKGSYSMKFAYYAIVGNPIVEKIRKEKGLIK